MTPRQRRPLLRAAGGAGAAAAAALLSLLVWAQQAARVTSFPQTIGSLTVDPGTDGSEPNHWSVRHVANFGDAMGGDPSYGDTMAFFTTDHAATPITYYTFVASSTAGNVTCTASSGAVTNVGSGRFALDALAAGTHSTITCTDTASNLYEFTVTYAVLDPRWNGSASWETINPVSVWTSTTSDWIWTQAGPMDEFTILATDTNPLPYRLYATTGLGTMNWTCTDDSGTALACTATYCDIELPLDTSTTLLCAVPLLSPYEVRINYVSVNPSFNGTYSWASHSPGSSWNPVTRELHIARDSSSATPVWFEFTGAPGLSCTASSASGPYTVTRQNGDMQYFGTAVYHVESASSNKFDLGSTVTITCGSYSFTVAYLAAPVVDTTPPIIITLPANISSDGWNYVEADGPMGTIFTYTLPAAVDDVDPHPFVVCSPASGSLFPLNVTTTVNCTATDDYGNTAWAMFEVFVVDTAPALLVNPGDMVRTAADSNGTAVYFSVTYSDEQDANPRLSCVPYRSGDTFPVGSTLVTCAVTDNMSNVAQVSFSVTVIDGSSNATTTNVCSPAALVMAEGGPFWGHVTSDWGYDAASPLQQLLPPQPEPPAGDPSSWMEPYGPGTRCAWVFNPPDGSVTSIRIRYLSTESFFDRLELWPTAEPITEEAQLSDVLAHLAGNTSSAPSAAASVTLANPAAPYAALSGSVRQDGLPDITVYGTFVLYFRSDLSGPGPGFWIEYKTTVDPGAYQAHRGAFLSYRNDAYGMSGFSAGNCSQTLFTQPPLFQQAIWVHDCAAP
ncbi:hypothetical protein HYH03_014274 [Edaphochlamys debaryana]|uniref:HYR domain-containing protein n=1 Tax=Edaphochlamys debaryana TaxID=47281 RepID=A0A835XQB7_9CHLO|nr:hypothetical protein HYH03_014274 [Edaphochlamys debaryana]|eukprot:KAG2487028.1 hypothetical protein HYH03_014274 [Edaphochlamys debaryana]